MSIRGENTYNDFVIKSKECTHLKINVDKYPKLKWYFDSKFEPGCHLYYYGNKVKSVGGINFDKTDIIIKRAISQIRGDSSLPKSIENTFSQPYYAWEADLCDYGLKSPSDGIQNTIATGFRGLATFTNGIATDDGLAHVRIKK